MSRKIRHPRLAILIRTTFAGKWESSESDAKMRLGEKVEMSGINAARPPKRVWQLSRRVIVDPDTSDPVDADGAISYTSSMPAS